MHKHLGIVGCSAEGAALCYRTFCLEASRQAGRYMHPEVSMHTNCLGAYMRAIEADDWQQVAALMLDSARKLAAAGAELLICPDNTIHQSMPIVMESSPLPWLHIADEAIASAAENGWTKVGVLGTKFLMEGPVYRESAARCGIAAVFPDADDRVSINRTIFEELVHGVIADTSRDYFNGVIDNLRRAGCQAVVLGCTEIPLLVDPETSPLPVLGLHAHFGSCCNSRDVALTAYKSALWSPRLVIILLYSA